MRTGLSADGRNEWLKCFRGSAGIYMGSLSRRVIDA